MKQALAIRGKREEETEKLLLILCKCMYLSVSIFSGSDLDEWNFICAFRFNRLYSQSEKIARWKFCYVLFGVCCLMHFFYSVL